MCWAFPVPLSCSCSQETKTAKTYGTLSFHSHVYTHPFNPSLHGDQTKALWMLSTFLPLSVITSVSTKYFLFFVLAVFLKYWLPSLIIFNTEFRVSKPWKCSSWISTHMATVSESSTYAPLSSLGQSTSKLAKGTRRGKISAEGPLPAFTHMPLTINSLQIVVLL